MATPYQTWVQNPAAFSARKFRDRTYGEESAQEGLDTAQFQQDWDAGKALYNDRFNPAVTPLGANTPSLEQWLGTNPLITTNPENDYVRQFYNIPTQKNDFLTDYGGQLAMLLATAGTAGWAGGAGGAASGGSGLLGASDVAALDAAGMGAGGNLGAGLGATATPSLTGTGLGAWDAVQGAGVPSASTLPAAAAPAASGGGSMGSGVLSKIAQSGGSFIPGVPNNVLLGGLQAGLGYLGSSQQADAYKDVAAQQGQYGAPYRSLLQQSYQPGFSLWDQPGYADAANRAADISTRQWAARAGNPAGNPTAQAGIYRDVLNETFLPAMSNYRGQLGQFGGMGLNTSAQASMAAAGQEGGMYNAIGYGLNTAMNPQSSYEDILKKYGLTIGGVSA